MKGVRSVSRFFFFFVVECPDALVLFVFKTISAHLSKTSLLYLYESTSGLPALFHLSICLFFCQYHVLISVALQSVLNLGSVSPQT